MKAAVTGNWTIAQWWSTSGSSLMNVHAALLDNFFLRSLSRVTGVCKNPFSASEEQWCHPDQVPCPPRLAPHARTERLCNVPLLSRLLFWLSLYNGPFSSSVWLSGCLTVCKFDCLFVNLAVWLASQTLPHCACRFWLYQWERGKLGISFCPLI